MFLSRLVKNARRSHFYLICYIYYIIWHIIETCFYILLATSNKIVFFYTIRIIESFFSFSSCYLSVFFALRKYPAVSHENLDIRKNFMSRLEFLKLCPCLDGPCIKIAMFLPHVFHIVLLLGNLFSSLFSVPY